MGKHYHFVGIGGVGMGTLASLLLGKGEKVSGSDLKANDLTRFLEVRGARIYSGHHERNVQNADVVVFSSAISLDNPELQEANRLKIPVIRRAELLAQLVNQQTGITIAGAHGKTTTTSMVSHILMKAGLNPTTAVGGTVNGEDVCNANLGSGTYFVAEADESDGTFLYFRPRYSVITNIDFEHVDYYKNWDNIVAAYREFIRCTRKDGCVIVCAQDPRLSRLVTEEKIPFMTYGLNPDCDIYAQNIETYGYRVRFDCFDRNQKLGELHLIVPGQHNVLNALAAISVGIKLNIPFETMAAALKTFSGARRRFQLKGDVNGVMVVDDYGHHPTEIMATLSAAQSFGRKRVVVVFQPHRYSRTKFLLDEFVQSFKLSDYLIVTDVYAASEQPEDGADIAELFPKIQKAYGENAVYLSKDKIVDHLLNITKPGDLLITLGAGDVTQISDQFVVACTKARASAAQPKKQKIS